MKAPSWLPMIVFALVGGACTVDPGDTGDGTGGQGEGQGGAAGGGQGGTGTAGAAGGGQGGTGGAMTGAGGTVCVPPTSGVNVAGQTAFQYGVNYAWASFGSDFGSATRGVAAMKAQRLTSLMDMKAHGVDLVRWWVFPNFQAGGVVFDTTGAPTGLGGTTAADIAAALDDAAQAGVHIQFT